MFLRHPLTYSTDPKGRVRTRIVPGIRSHFILFEALISKHKGEKKIEESEISAAKCTGKSSVCSEYMVQS